MKISSRITVEDIRKLGWEEDYKTFNRSVDALKKRIASVRGIERDLYSVAEGDAGKRDAILELLAELVRDLPHNWRGALRKNQSTYRNAANELHSAINAVEKAASIPVELNEWLLAILNPGVTITVDELQKQRVKKQISRMLRLMRAHEEYALALAKQLGSFSRTQAQLIRRRDLARLMWYVRQITGKNCDDVIARLATDAHVAIGSKKRFSADQIKKLRQRHPDSLRPLFEESKS